MLAIVDRGRRRRAAMETIEVKRLSLDIQINPVSRPQLPSWAPRLAIYSTAGADGGDSDRVNQADYGWARMNSMLCLYVS